MKKTLLLPLALIFTAVCVSQNKATVTGKIKTDLKIAKVSLDYRKDDDYVKDTTLVNGGKFHFLVDVPEPTFAILRVKYEASQNKRGLYEARQIFLEPNVENTIIITDSLKSAEITGGEAMQDFASLQRTLQPFDEKRIALQAAYHKSWTDKDSIGMAQISNQLDVLDSVIRKTFISHFSTVKQGLQSDCMPLTLISDTTYNRQKPCGILRNYRLKTNVHRRVNNCGSGLHLRGKQRLVQWR